MSKPTTPVIDEADLKDVNPATPAVFNPEEAKKRMSQALDLIPADDEPAPETDGEPTPEPITEPEPTASDDEPVSNSEVDDDPEVAESDDVDLDDDDIDLDASLDDDPEDDEDDDGIDDDTLKAIRSDDSHAVKEARKKGREVKRLEAELAAAEADKMELENRASTAETELQKLSNSSIDPTTHPEFKELRDNTRSQILRQVRTLPFPVSEKVIAGSWGTLATGLKAIDDYPIEQQDEALSDYRLNLAKQLGYVDDSTEELTWEYDSEVMSHTNQIIGVLQNHTPTISKLESLYETIQKKSEKGALAVDYNTYKERIAPYEAAMNGLATLDEKTIEEDPYSLESVVAKKVQGDEKARKRYDKIVKGLLDVSNGPRALSQTEYDQLASVNRDISEFEKNRAAKVENTRLEWLPQIAAMLFLKPELNSLLFESEKSRSASDAIARKKKRAADAASKKEDPVPEPTKPEEFNAKIGQQKVDKILGW